MLLVSHAIVTAINVGKVVIKKAPWELNITEIICVIKYGINVFSCKDIIPIEIEIINEIKDVLII